MRRRVMACAAATAAASACVTGPALAAPAPTGPVATNGAKVSLVTAGLQTPTSFAFGDGTVFVSDAGTQKPTPAPGGVYHVAHGHATRLAGSPGFVTGLAFHRGTLYVAGGFLGAGAPVFRVLAWSGWNGTAFAKQRVVYTAPKGFAGFNGIAFGPDGRLFVGTDLGESNDHSAAKTPYVYDILTMSTTGKHLKVYASGIRQPWQFAFAKGNASPYVTNFGQDTGVKKPLDTILHVKKGDNYGFPQCAFTRSAKCKGFAKPYKVFAPHTDNGGIAIVGRTMYLGQFGFGNGKPAVIAISMKTGKITKIVSSSMPNAIMAIGVHAGYLYIGTGAVGPGAVYRVKL